jgi:nucleotide-binding universal stress UspA family protein
MTASSAPGARPPSVVVRASAADLPQSRRQWGTDAAAGTRAYGRGVFARLLVVIAGRTDGRDALVLGAQLAARDGELVVAHALETPRAPLTGGTRAAADRVERLRDAGEEVYATLGPDPRVRYLTLSGLPLADAAIAVARHERADAIVIGQNLLSRDYGIERLIAGAPWPVAVAPYGHRFARGRATARIAVVCDGSERALRAVQVAGALARDVRADLRLLVAGDSRADAWVGDAHGLAPKAPVVRLEGGTRAALVAQSRGDVDLIVVARHDGELLRQAACPLLVLPGRAAPAATLAEEVRR